MILTVKKIHGVDELHPSRNHDKPNVISVCWIVKQTKNLREDSKT